MISRTTFHDLVDHGLDYIGGNPSDNAKRDCIRAALEAYRDLANAFNWSYLYTHGRIVTSAAYDGTIGYGGTPNLTLPTIQYKQSSGTYPQMVTLTGDMWPDWAGDGAYIRLNVTDSSGASTLVAYRVKERKSATVLTLTDTLNPFEDLPAGTSFILYRDTYLLPEDYIAQDQSLYERNFGGMEFRHPRDWLYENRYVFAQGVPLYYTIVGDPQYPGRLSMKIFPWPIEAKSVDFVYKRRPRPLMNLLYSGGTSTVSVTAGSQTVIGVGTTFTPAMVGSVIRIASGGTKAPSSLIMGEQRVILESVITAYVSATSVTISDPADIAYTTSPYTISDSIDIEQGVMLNALLRGVEKHLGMNRTLKDKPSALKQYDIALSEAKSADSRSFTGRSVGQKGHMRMRLRDFPYTNAIE
jgi:hypothetical protein